MHELNKMLERLKTRIQKLDFERDSVVRRLDQIDAETQGLRHAVDEVDSLIRKLEKEEANV